MAEVSATAAGEQYDLKSYLVGEDRDFLVRNNGDQVKVTDIKGKVVGVYFSASWCGPCHRFTPKLAEAYNELAAKNAGFEVVFVSADEDEESFRKYFSAMPWLAVPFSDSTTRQQLDELFTVQGIPHLVVLDKDGVVATDEGVEAVMEYGAEAYPFTREKIDQLKADAEAAKENQTLRSVLASSSRDFVVSSDGGKVPISELEGKIVGLYFALNSYGSCRSFTPKLVEVYQKLKEQGENFEVVLVALDDDESAFQEGFASMPWLALPFKDKSCEKLTRYFELATVPTLVIIGDDGKTLMSNAAELVEEHGVDAYPFSPEKLGELAEKERLRMEAQTLESLLVSGERDYVIGKDGTKVPVADLVGKNILLYFSAHWCPPCRAFLPTLIDAYNKIKAKDPAFELIFISSDRDQAAFDDYFASMPWLAIPFGDERKTSLSRTFKIHGIPSLVAIGPTGRTVTTEARDLIMTHGADAYPFTEERLKELEAAAEEEARSLPETLQHPLHEEHELVRTKRMAFVCDACSDRGSGWSFYCEECDFDLHPKCAMDKKDEEKGKEGYVCDGDVCYKV